MSKHALFLVPHADDEVLGFGGTISKYVNLGYNVSVTITQAPNNDRAAQQLEDSKKAKAILGYKNINFLHISHIDMCNNLHLLIHTVQDHLVDAKPDILFSTHYSDNHQDHKNLYRAVAVATRPNGAVFIPRIIAGEIISSCDQSYGIERATFIPNYYEGLDETNIDTKINALKLYSTEIREYPHPRCPQSIKAKAITRGSECKRKYAEAFMVLRDINE